MKIEVVKIHNPEAKNLIFGQSHFIKTVEDIHEVLVGAVPDIKFVIAFCEASAHRKIRTSGTSKEMTVLALKHAQAVG